MVTSGGGFTPATPALDTTPPTITSTASSPSATTATITWNTNEAANSSITYGLTSSYGLASTSASLTTSHSIRITGLTANTTYHYAITSADALGNTTTSSDATFTTLFQITGLPNWSSAVQAVLAGQRNARVIFIGDSTTAGYDAGNGVLSNNNKAESPPTVVAGLFPNGLGSSTSISGNQNASNTSLYDTRTSFGAGWTFSSGLSGQVLGGFAIESVTTATDFNFVPGKSWDTAELYYSSYPTAGGTANLSINGTGSIGTVVTLSDATAFNKATVTKTLGNDTFNTKRLTGTQYDFESIVLYNSAVKEITVMNAGWSGSKAINLTTGTGPWSTINSMATYDPDLVVIDMGINDYNLASPTSEISFKASMQSVINAATAAGADVLLVVPVPSGTANGIAHQGAFQTYIHDLATTNNLPTVDFISSWGSYASANANGWMSDTLHPNVTGYAQKAQTLFSAIWQ
jgi:lysophospholipase L1-like esterase